MAKFGSESRWMCNRCKVPVEIQTVRLQYLRTIFALHLPVCPKCGMILIDEELATGKMAEAEQILEDK
ncbi:MAG TPA: DNA-binding protein [Thermodesulfobacteriota bacterium]|nr:DNA-binding protein [Thermodesulfobacteriota bacterium]